MQYLKLFLLIGLIRFGHSVPLETIYDKQVKLLVEIIKTLNQQKEFDNIIFYRTPDKFYEAPYKYTQILRNSSYLFKSVGDMLTDYMFASGINKPIMTFSIEPWDYVNDTDSIPNLGKFLTNRNLAVVIVNDIFDTDVKEFVSTSLGASLGTKMVFLLIGAELTDVVSFIRVEKLKRFFRWCWSKNMLNVVLLFQKDAIVENIDELQLEVYSYTPFPKPIKLLLMTNVDPEEYFVDRTTDLMGYEFKTPVFNDKPSVFKAIDPELGIEHVSGISGHVYMEFVNKINGKFVELIPETSILSIVDYQNDLLVARNIDIGIHPFTFLLPNNYFGSYPISNTNSCVVVPVVSEIFKGFYLPLTLNYNMWVLLLLMFIVFQLVYCCIDKFGYGKWSAWQAFDNAMRGMLSWPLNYFEVRSSGLCPLASKRKALIHMLVILSGMLFSLIYIAALTSSLSATIEGKQYESLEDLRAANVSIMLLDYMFYTYNYLNLIPVEFTPNLVITDVDTVSRHLNSFDTSYAYIVYNEEWEVMQDLQRNLWKPRFRVAQKLCIANIFLTLPMQFNSPFYHPLKNFILRTQETGLEMKWTEDILRDIRLTTSGKKSLMENREHPASLTLEHLVGLWLVYVLGIILAGLAFFWELKSKTNKKIKKIKVKKIKIKKIRTKK